MNTNQILFRPKTRGELRDKLKEGISCEVALIVTEGTVLLLRGWLNYENFITKPSPNTGYMIFEPKPQ